jgi:phospholipase/carboxylesterase
MVYTTRRPHEQAKNPPTIIVLHGFGADEYDLLPIASHLDPSLLVISIQAPIELHWGGYAWYNLEQTPEGLRGDNPTRILSEESLIESLPEIVAKESGDLQNIFILGFSQGAAMAFSLIGRHDLSELRMKIHGVIILSGYVPDDVRAVIIHKDLSEIPFFISHGTYDELIPIQALENSTAILEHTGSKIFAKEYETGHGLTEETVSDIRNWMKPLLR